METSRARHARVKRVHELYAPPPRYGEQHARDIMRRDPRRSSIARSVRLLLLSLVKRNRDSALEREPRADDEQLIRETEEGATSPRQSDQRF